MERRIGLNFFLIERAKSEEKTVSAMCPCLLLCPALANENYSDDSSGHKSMCRLYPESSMEFGDYQLRRSHNSYRH